VEQQAGILIRVYEGERLLVKVFFFFFFITLEPKVE